MLKGINPQLYKPKVKNNFPKTLKAEVLLFLKMYNNYSDLASVYALPSVYSMISRKGAEVASLISKEMILTTKKSRLLKDCQGYQYLIYNAKGRDLRVAIQVSQGQTVHKPGQAITSS